MGFVLSKLLPLLVYPLGLAMVLQIVGLAGRRRRWGPHFSLLGLGLLWLASMPLASRQLVWGLEERAVRLTSDPLPSADAVMVLGGGLQAPVSPRRNVEVSEAGDRLLTGVGLIHEGKAPWLLVSGGRISFRRDDPTPTEARSAARLAVDLGVNDDRLVLSDLARNTAEEAMALQKIAKHRGWRSVLLVTSATHLPRSVASFRRLTDLEIIPVACDYQLPERALYGTPTLQSGLKGILPSSTALNATTSVLKEWLGLTIYRFRGWA